MRTWDTRGGQDSARSKTFRQPDRPDGFEALPTSDFLYLSLLLYHHHCPVNDSRLYLHPTKDLPMVILLLYIFRLKRNLSLFLDLSSSSSFLHPHIHVIPANCWQNIPQVPSFNLREISYKSSFFSHLKLLLLAVAIPTYLHTVHFWSEPTRVNTVDSTGWLWACVYHSSSSAINVFTVFALQNITISSASETPLRPASRYQRHVVHKPCHTIHTIATAPRPGRYLLTQLT